MIAHAGYDIEEDLHWAGALQWRGGDLLEGGVFLTDDPRLP